MINLQEKKNGEKKSKKKIEMNGWRYSNSNVGNNREKKKNQKIMEGNCSKQVTNVTQQEIRKIQKVK